ncbi:DNA-(apurinic or apyrimidinic site) endonuclease 2 [Nothobranchius furzeri]|uniref:DNA-(apurinic or apyrimidinic site) endonuclease n=2 Tax=Nothobranchius furzeri TaxID=105023 RepID=A0A1A7Z8B7_NOTFU|nr:DNA-(apurinic or apyrimidinic site) lyase 2 [Nothobranchius furzeri]KAF7209334.1 apurinic/apyrimidinic endodeoxyribonuclease 2 [Nothobranchius furzeri]
MKIVTWNINGIRTFKGGIKKTLDSLDADIICVQETKVTRDLLDEKTAIVEGYNSFFSFSRGRSGYSGVATYCKDIGTPLAAEEGLTGLLTNHEGAVGCYGDHTDFSNEELQLLDSEGRALITQHKILCQDKEQTVTVINVYCPRADPEKPDRKQFKLQFYKLLRCRAEALLKDGSHVIILGDVNTSHRPIDHCDPDDVDDFAENPGRKWLNEFLHSGSPDDDDAEKDHDVESEVTDRIPAGKFVDTFRYFHPARTNAFTCWSTLTGARQTNYGTRIDYIFANYELVTEQFVAADITPEVEGSDHCPVWARLCCSLLPSSKPPPLCTRYLPEFAGKQQKLSRFLVKVDQKRTQPEQKTILPGSQEEEERRENLNPFLKDSITGKKRPLISDSAVPKGKKTKLGSSSVKPQGNLLSFFKPKSVRDKALVLDEGSPTHSSQREAPTTDLSSATDASTEPGLAQPCDSRTTTETRKPSTLTTQPNAGQSEVKKGSSSVFWKSVLRGPPPPPCCKVHGEPCVLRTVKKEGPNVGKRFFVCCRPQGHASNPEARCSFFAWVDKGK